MSEPISGGSIKKTSPPPPPQSSSSSPSSSSPPQQQQQHPKTPLTSQPKTPVVKKYNSILKLPVSTKTIDLKRASKWLARYLRTECPQYENLIITVILDYLGAHKTPDPKVLQVQLDNMGIVPLDQVQRLMRKFWTTLVYGQAVHQEKHSEKQKTTPAPSSSPKDQFTPSQPVGKNSEEAYSRASTGLQYSGQGPGLATWGALNGDRPAYGHAHAEFLGSMYTRPPDMPSGQYYAAMAQYTYADPYYYNNQPQAGHVYSQSYFT